MDSSVQPGDDGSTPDTGVTTQDAGDGGTHVDAAPTPVHAKTLLVHGSAWAPSLRFCYGVVIGADGGTGGTSTVAMMTYPIPNSALGVPPGTGGAGPDTPLAESIAKAELRVYAINAAKIASQTVDAGAAELTCPDLVGSLAKAADAGGLGLTEGVDYWVLGDLPAHTLVDDTTTLIVVNGCAPGAPDPSYNCPTPYDNTTGNLGLKYVKLDTATQVDGGATGAQFFYASQPFSSALGLGPDTSAAGGAVAAGFYVTSTPDAGTPSDAGADDAGDGAVEAAAPVPVVSFLPVALGATVGTLKPTTLALVPGVTFDANSGFVVNAIGNDAGVSGKPAAFPFTAIQAISEPGVTTPVFTNGNGYVYILVGDPGLPTFLGADGGAATQDTGQFNVLSVHVLGYPVNPPFAN
jgi:hypothetical protein